MNWNRGFSARYYATYVDASTWRDTERFEITGGSISRQLSDLLESATLDCVNYPQNTERWVRVYLDARQDGASEHIPLFTGLAVAPDRDIDGRFITSGVQCYSVLQAAADVLLPRGWYAPVGIAGAEIIRDLLKVTPAPVEIDPDSPPLKNAIIAEKNESNLTMAGKILTAINMRLRILGDGTIQVTGKATEPSAVFDIFENDSIEPKLSTKSDWYNCPNVFRAVIGDTYAVARDDSEGSILSVPTRGREVWMEETNCKLNENETLADYARRRLKEEQQTSYIAHYDRRFRPDVTVSDFVELRYPAQDLIGVFAVRNQTIELGYGARTTEEVEFIR